ncbi:MAG TPA: amidohydrolase family protein [Nitrosopumilaceae archaeon]|nr:amidohydrolase family protein [Nitrosopumilaceae archaeon]
MIIDCHTHLNQYGSLENISSLDDRVKKLHLSMTSHNVDYALVLSSYYVNEERPSTEQLIEATKKYDNIGIVAGYSIDNNDGEDLKQYERWIKDGRVKGLKIYCGYEHYYPYDKRYQKVYDVCVEFGIPVMIHSGDTFTEKGKLKFSHPIHVDEVAVDNPELKVVVCHLGNPWIEDCQEIIYKNDNVYADMSGLAVGKFDHFFEKIMAEKVAELINYAGEPNYLLYGTDWPISDMDSYLSFVAKLKLKPDYRDRLMYKNSKALFKI